MSGTTPSTRKNDHPRMASVSDLNIRLGLLDKNFSRQLAKVERDMRASVQRMGALGEQMTLAVSAPLGLIGGLALKTAAEFESLTLAMNTTFESVGRGAGEAAAEINALRVAALAPGLDFEQAVKGSVRLQGVGISAEKARLILAELGNQIASTGGSADQLDAVTKQFTQIIGKGRLLQEDLSIILENMPGLARVLKEEFGTTSAEAIRALGVSADEFIERITDRMATMPRVAGGLTNAFTNAGVAIRQSLATVGEAINKTFNVTGLLNNFSEWIVGLADAFAGLSGGTQAVILSIGAFALALGPAIKGLSLLQGAWISIVSGIAPMVAAFRTATVAGTGLTGALTAMNTAARLNVFIAAASVVIALGVAIATYVSRVDSATESQRMFAEAQAKVNEEAGRETAILNKNFEVLKSATATTDQRRAAIDELKKVYPDYLRGVDLETASLTKLTDIQAGLNQEILRGVAERQKAVAVESQFAKAAEAQLRIQQLKEKGFSGITGEEVKRSGRSVFGTDFEKQFVQESARAEVVRDVIKALENDVKSATKTADELSKSFDKAFGIGANSANRQYDALTKQRQALEDAKDALEDMTPAQRAALEFSENWDKRMASNKESAKGAFKESKAQANAYRDALASIRAVTEKGDVLGADVFGEQATEITNQIERLIEAGFKPAGKEVQHLRSMLVDMRESLEKGFAVPNSTQAVLAEMDKIDAAIAQVNDAVAPIEIPVPQVEPIVQEIQRVSDALSKISSPKPEPLPLSSPAVPGLPTLPSLSVPTAVVQLDTSAAQAGLESLKETATAAIESNTAYLGSWQQIADVMVLATEGLNGFSAAMQAAMDIAAEQGDVLGNIALVVGQSVADAAAQGAASFGELANAAVAAAAKIVRAWIQQGVASAVSKALGSLPFPFNLAAGAAAGGLAAALFTRAISAIGVPALAEGGVVRKPTLALIGEYPGASTNPEIVTPERKLRSIFRDSAAGGGGKLVAVVRGDDLQFILDRAAARRGRTR